MAAHCRSAEFVELTSVRQSLARSNEQHARNLFLDMSIMESIELTLFHDEWGESQTHRMALAIRVMQVCHVFHILRTHFHSSKDHVGMAGIAVKLGFISHSTLDKRTNYVHIHSSRNGDKHDQVD